MTFLGETEQFSGRIGALRWSILVGKPKHNVEKPRRDELSRAARFSPNAVIIKPYCRLKIELTFLDTHNNFFISGIQVFLCRSFL